MQNVNYSVNYLVHAYKQAPWRIQRQWIGTSLAIMLVMTMVSSLYLYVTSQAAITGREIQSLNAETISVQHGNADLQTKLASLTSNNAMETRAKALGYQPVDPTQVDYVVVPGYVAPKPAILASAPSLRPSSPSVPPEYTESLIDWLDQRLRAPTTTTMIGAAQ